MADAIGLSTPYVPPPTQPQDNWAGTPLQAQTTTGLTIDWRSPARVHAGQVFHTSVAYFPVTGSSTAWLQQLANDGYNGSMQDLRNAAYDPAYDPRVWGNQQNAFIRDNLPKPPVP